MSFPLKRGELSKEEFDFLVALARPEEYSLLFSQSNYSLELKGKIEKKFQELNLIDDNGNITKKGLMALEPYRVQRACLLAAGFGERLLPITVNTPKPMVSVNGTRIIETLLDALIQAEISEIYIVRGYLGEQFDLLLRKYPMIRFVDNPYYASTNNISSALMFGERIQNSYIIESDLYLINPNLITKYQYSTNYLGIPVKETSDYCFHVEDNIMTGVTIGGHDCYQVVGITYWNEEDGNRLFRQIKEMFNRPDGKNLFFGSIATKYHIDDYKIALRECSQNDVFEIDSFEELKKIDKRYR